MATFRFEAMDTTGGEVKDSVEATNEEEAQQKIRQMGYFVTKLTEVSAAKGKKEKKGGKAGGRRQGHEGREPRIFAGGAGGSKRQHPFDRYRSLQEIQRQSWPRRRRYGVARGRHLPGEPFPK